MTKTPIISSPAPAPAAAIQHQSAVVPYLFGGLAAMLGLIAMALLILACSYLKKSEREPGELLESNQKAENSGKMTIPVLKEIIVVIMAGDVKPTFLATPISGGDGGCDKEENNDQSDDNKPKQTETESEEIIDQEATIHTPNL